MTARKPWTVVEGAAFIQPTEADSQRWLVKGVLPRRGLAILYGPPGSGKSFFALDLFQAVHRAQRTEIETFLDDDTSMAAIHAHNAARPLTWCGHRIKFCGPVIYLTLEGSAGSKLRLRAYSQVHGTEELFYVSDSPISLGGRDSADQIEQIAAQLIAARIEPAAILIDTLSRATPGIDENSSEMGVVIAQLDALGKKLGCLVAVVAHTGKDPSKGVRGWSGQEGAADTMISFEHKALGPRVATLTKQKDGEEGLSWFFSLDVVQLGLDDDGDPVTSCTVNHLDKSEAAAIRTAPEARGKYQVAIAEAMEGTKGPVPVADVIADAIDLLKVAAEQEARARYDVGRAMGKLLEKRFLFASTDGLSVSLTAIPLPPEEFPDE